MYAQCYRILYDSLKQLHAVQMDGRSMMSVRAGGDDDTGGTTRQLFCKIAYYRGATVAVKPVNKTSVSLTEDLLEELVQVKYFKRQTGRS